MSDLSGNRFARQAGRSRQAQSEKKPAKKAEGEKASKRADNDVSANSATLDSAAPETRVPAIAPGHRAASAAPGLASNLESSTLAGAPNPMPESKPERETETDSTTAPAASPAAVPRRSIKDFLQEAPETKRRRVQIVVKRTDYDKWKRYADENGVSITQLIEISVNTFVDESI